MKTFLILIFLAITTFLNAQDPITVTVTGTCYLMSNQYTYNGLLNGKNDYIYYYSDSTGDFEFRISFDGVKWVCYADDLITETAFYNNNVPVGLLPPNTGWIADICDGTLEISGGTLNLNDYYVNVFNIYPNPAHNFFVIDSDIPINKITIYNSLGKIIKRIDDATVKNTFDVSSLKSGIYFLKIYFNNNIITKRIIKK
ncbi:MAG: T9SS type A sorting domain-containing protein [Flavobacteriaceae bacterium]|nr:T9SS type A sorting domain-containing protein [Flavobacteriaceae bacterium]